MAPGWHTRRSLQAVLSWERKVQKARRRPNFSEVDDAEKTIAYYTIGNYENG